ncbi:MAG: hypothetical protein R2854_04205 [Caldilineaceae bacterium]
MIVAFLLLAVGTYYLDWRSTEALDTINSFSRPTSSPTWRRRPNCCAPSPAA